MARNSIRIPANRQRSQEEQETSDGEAGPRQPGFRRSVREQRLRHSDGNGNAPYNMQRGHANHPERRRSKSRPEPIGQQVQMHVIRIEDGLVNNAFLKNGVSHSKSQVYRPTPAFPPNDLTDQHGATPVCTDKEGQWCQICDAKIAQQVLSYKRREQSKR